MPSEDFTSEKKVKEVKSTKGQENKVLMMYDQKKEFTDLWSVILKLAGFVFASA